MGKLRLQFIGPFEILEKIGNVAYRFTLAPKLVAMLNAFHISNLRKYIHDPNHMVNYQTTDVQKDLSREEVSMMIWIEKFTS